MNPPRPATCRQFDESRSRPFFALIGAILLGVAITGCVTPQRPEDLVDVEKTIPGIVLDIRYATTNNFTGQKLYPSAKCYLRRAATEKLHAAQKEFSTLGYGLKIYDGYRPLSVQRKMWEVFPQPGYVADPKKGSRHNRGAAVDVTLIRLSDGSEIPMPTSYDDFTERAHRDFKDLPEDVIRNRELLERVLTKHGFVGLPTEWWHFDDADWRNYPLLDLPVPPAR
jgi:D-alanyl-D-alanine dipeptidase